MISLESLAPMNPAPVRRTITSIVDLQNGEVKHVVRGGVVVVSVECATENTKPGAEIRRSEFFIR